MKKQIAGLIICCLCAISCSENTNEQEMVYKNIYTQFKTEELKSMDKLVEVNIENDIFYIEWSWIPFVNKKSRYLLTKCKHKWLKTERGRRFFQLLYEERQLARKIRKDGVTDTNLRKLEEILTGYHSICENNKEITSVVYLECKRLSMLSAMGKIAMKDSKLIRREMPTSVEDEPVLNYYGVKFDIPEHSVQFYLRGANLPEWENELRATSPQNAVPIIFIIKLFAGILSESDVVEMERFVDLNPSNLDAQFVLYHTYWRDKEYYPLLNLNYNEWERALKGFLTLARQGHAKSEWFLEFYLGKQEADKMLRNR